MGFGCKQNLCRGGFGDVLNVKITSECNGSCSFCIEKHGYCPEPVCVQTLIDASNSLSGFKTVLVLGGEPFMYPDLLCYLKGLRGKDRVYLTTNGTCFDPATLPEIAKYLTAVSISIHHYDLEKNAGIVGAYVGEAELKKAVSILREAGVDVRLNVNLTTQGICNMQEVLKMCEFAKRLGVNSVRFVELQDETDLFVYASEVFNDRYVNLDPYNEGCEQRMGEIGGIPVVLKLACGLNSPYKPIPNNTNPRKFELRVLYPNGKTYYGWVNADDNLCSGE